MSTILKSYDWSFVSRTNKRARSQNYPWNDWFDGRIHRLEPGVDFDGPAAGLERVIRTSANRRGIKVRIRIDEGAVIVQQHDGTEPLRTVTKSPSLRSIQEAREAQEAANAKAIKAAQKAVKARTNGHKANGVKPTSKTAKAIVAKGTPTKTLKRVSKRVTAPV